MPNTNKRCEVCGDWESHCKCFFCQNLLVPKNPATKCKQKYISEVITFAKDGKEEIRPKILFCQKCIERENKKYFDKQLRIRGRYNIQDEKDYTKEEKPGIIKQYEEVPD